MNNDPQLTNLEYTDDESDLEGGATQSYKAFNLGVESSEVKLTPQLWEEYKETIFASRPNIARLYEQIGTYPAVVFSRTHVRENRNKIIKERRQECLDVIKEEVRQLLGSTIAESVGKQLKANHSISTVQHFSPIGHPDSLNATLQNALAYFGSNDPSLKNIIVLACGNVSFNNTKFPRGHLFHTSSGQEVHTNQLTFLGHTVDSRPVLNHAPYSPEDIQMALNSLLQLKREAKITDEQYESLKDLTENIYGSPHAMSQDTFTDQITVTNYWLFKKLFQKFNRSVPNLVYLAHENISLKLLLTHHIDQKTAIHNFLFNPQYLDLIETHFEGITKAFDKSKNIGTFLFWGLPKDGKYRVQLWRNDRYLESKDGSYKVALTPEAIKQAIVNKELIPSVMLSYCILAFYYGLILGGGYEQTYYLTQMKKAYVAVMETMGDMESSEAVSDLITTNLVIPRPQFTYIAANNNCRYPATALDLYLYSDFGKNWQRILDATKRVMMKEIIERTLVSTYREYTKDAKNYETFSKLTERDIELFNGLDQKIPAVASI